VTGRAPTRRCAHCNAVNLVARKACGVCEAVMPPATSPVLFRPAESTEKTAAISAAISAEKSAQMGGRVGTNTWLQREREAIRAEVAAEVSARIGHEGGCAPWALLDALVADYQEPVAGHPLGVGMPSGATTRVDGETHLEAWKRVLRDDPCAYCDEDASGTVDHVQPRSSGRKYRERWTNLVGACSGCNQSKGSKPLLLWLLRRAKPEQVRQPQRQRAPSGELRRESDAEDPVHGRVVGQRAAA
jgi:HNH endonuclease